MQADQFRVEKTDLCLPHSILLKHCTQCQMAEFDAQVKERGSPTHANIIDNIIAPSVIGQGQFFSLDFRYAADNEIEAGGLELVDGEICHGLLPAAHPQPEPPSGEFDLKTLRIVFVGPRESFIGFMCCLLYKYGQTTIVPLGLEFGSSDSVPASFIAEIQARWHFGGDLGECIYVRHPEAEAVFSYPHGADYGQHFSAANARQFWSGYRKMLDLKISEVQDGIDDELQIHLRKLGHAEQCGDCSPDHDGEDPYYGDIVQEAEILAMGPVECHAYWYYL